MTFGFSRYLIGVVLFSLMTIGQLIGRPGLAALSDDEAAALIVPPYTNWVRASTIDRSGMS